MRLYDELLKLGRHRPEDLKPDTTACQWLVDAYDDLSSERRYAGGQIPHSVIAAYGAAHDLGPHFVAMVSALDCENLAEAAKRD